MNKTHLPIAQPCHENWDAMDPVERGRFCHSCSKQVHDLSSMTEREAKRLFSERCGERICVRYGCDKRGKIRFAPERIVGAAVLAVALAACTSHRKDPEHEPVKMGAIEAVHVEEELMGDIAVEPQRTPEPEVEFVKGDVAVPETEEVQPCGLTTPEAAAEARAKQAEAEK